MRHTAPLHFDNLGGLPTPFDLDHLGFIFQLRGRLVTHLTHGVSVLVIFIRIRPEDKDITRHTHEGGTPHQTLQYRSIVTAFVEVTNRDDGAIVMSWQQGTEA